MIAKRRPELDKEGWIIDLAGNKLGRHQEPSDMPGDNAKDWDWAADPGLC